MHYSDKYLVFEYTLLKVWNSYEHKGLVAVVTYRILSHLNRPRSRDLRHTARPAVYNARQIHTWTGCLGRTLCWLQEQQQQTHLTSWASSVPQ